MALLHPIGQGIKTLELGGFRCTDSVHRMLGFHMDDPDHKILSNLETLIIYPNAAVDFAGFCRCLLEGRLPKLIKLSVSDGWFRVNAVMTET